MSKHKLLRSKWFYILSGIIIGVAFTIGFNVTSASHAYPDITAQMEPAAETPPVDQADLN